MNAFPSDTIYRSQLARNQEMLAEAAAERDAHALRKAPTAGVARLLVYAIRKRPAATATGTRRIAAAE